jgi:pre-mRNA-processing factor 40
MQPPTVFLNQTASRPITYTTLTTAGVPSDPRQQYSRDITPTAFSNVRPDPRSAPAAPTFASHQAVALGNATQPVQNVTYSQDHIDQAWIEYTPPNGGTKYYYNSITRSSQYEIPTSFKAKESHPKKTEKVSDSPVWKEYTDRTTGKKYFSDGKTTTWDRPACMETTEERKSKEESPGPPRKKKKQAKHDFEFGNKEEAVAAFKGLLLAKEILPSMKWNDVIKLCSSDHRWDACEAVLTTGERKQAMAEYQTKRANELKTIEREEKIRAKEAFLQMLSNTLSSSPSFSCWTSRFGDVRDLLAKDDRFHAVATEGERESLFLDFCEDFKKREERRKKEQKNEIKSAFHGFLMEKEEQGSLTFSSTWKSFLSTLTDEEKSDPRFIVSNLMNHSDRQLYFADYVIELQAEEDDKRNRIRGARRRAEKAQREALEDALHQLARDGKILPSSTWRSVEDIITSLPSYGPVNDQDREAPREMFESFVVDWSETYKRDRMVLSQIFSSASKNQFVITPNTSYEEFTKALLEAASDTSDLHALARRIINRSEPLSSARMYLKELILEAKGISGAVIARAIRRRSGHDSSEDEGEIVEEDAIELV